MLKDFEKERQRQGRTTRLLDIQGKAFSFKLYYLNNSYKKERLEELPKETSTSTRYKKQKQKYASTRLSGLRQSMLLGEGIDNTAVDTNVLSNAESNIVKTTKAQRGEFQTAAETASRKNVPQIQFDVFNNLAATTS